MSDFADAAQAVLDQLDAIDVDVFVGRLETLTRECEAHRTAVDADWDAFWSAAVALVGRVESASATVAADSTEAGQALETILPAATAASTDLDPPCTAVYECLDRLGGRSSLFRAALDEWLPEQILAPGQQLAGEMDALVVALDDVVKAMTAAFENEVSVQIDEHANGIRWYADASSKLARAGGVLVTILLEEWAGRLAGMVDLVERLGFEPAFAHVNEAIAHALEESEPERASELAAAMDPVQDATAQLTELAADAAGHAVNLATTGREVNEGLGALITAVTTSTAELNATTTQLAERGFRTGS